MISTIRFTSFPLTEPPPGFIELVIAIFKKHETTIATRSLIKGLSSDEILIKLGPEFISQGWNIETGKSKDKIIKRPVFYGENGVPKLQYQIDGYHNEWKCGIEIEAGRAWMGNAVYRDLIQALIMVRVEHLILAVPNRYKYLTKGKETISNDYDNSIAVAEALFGHSRILMPYGLTIIGY